ncbi:MAG: hypothetical protein IJN65_04980 [Clostridia bacterium]|nr:hypothetical protein [Clostridia bacterium]
MSEVLCWCCEHFSLVDEDNYIGVCKLDESQKSAYCTVCEEFLIRSGLFTKRTIPDYCKNKHITLRVTNTTLADFLKKDKNNEKTKISFD